MYHESKDYEIETSYKKLSNGTHTHSQTIKALVFPPKDFSLSLVLKDKRVILHLSLCNVNLYEHEETIKFLYISRNVSFQEGKH